MTIAFYISAADTHTAPAFDSPDNARGYAQLFRELLTHNAEVFVVFRAEENYQQNGKFKQSWRAKLEKDTVIYEKNDHEIHVDLLYDKNHFPFSDIPKINPDKISEVCNDKYLTYLFAPDFSATSFLLENEVQLQVLRAKYNDKKIALKELRGYGGEKVFVGYLRDFSGNLQFPLLAQEFIDTSHGFSGLVEGIHDVRVGVFNGEVIHGLLRWPAHENELRTNLHLGGKLRALYVSEIPEELKSIARKLDERFGIDAPRFFSADFGFDGTNWRLFELNASPGIWSRETFGVANDEFLSLLAEKIVESAKRCQTH